MDRPQEVSNDTILPTNDLLAKNKEPDAGAKGSPFGAALVGLAGAAIVAAVGVVVSQMIPPVWVDEPCLHYLFDRTETFSVEVPTSDDEVELAVMSLRVWNSGTAPVEHLTATLRFGSAQQVEVVVRGIPEGARTVEVSSAHVEVTAPFLNPREYVSIQVLVKLQTATRHSPSILVRGRGVAGRERPHDLVEPTGETPS